jgi:hypothetical protein
MNHLLEEIDDILKHSTEEQWKEEKENLIKMFKKKRTRNIEHSMYALKGIVRDVHGFSLLKVYFSERIVEKTILGKMKEEEKRWLLEEIRKEIETYSFWEEKQYVKSMFEPIIKPIKERVKMVTKGKDTTPYYFLPKKDEKRIKRRWVELLMLILEKELGINTEENNMKIVQLILSFVSNPCITKLNLNDLTSEKTVNSMKKSEEIKEMLKSFYGLFQRKWMKTLVSHVESWNIESVGDIYYLLTDDKKKELKQNYEIFFQKELQKIKKEEVVNNKKLQQLKEKILMVKGWNG